MTIEIFLVLLLFFSTIAGFVTEGAKKIFNKTPSNLLAMISAIAVGVIGMVIYMILNNIEITAIAIIWSVLMGFACGGCSMVGYDKIKQFLEQFKTIHM